MKAGPSPWVVRFADEVPPAGAVLDLAAGRGRHTRLMLRRGHSVAAVDRDLSGLADLRGEPALTLIEADLEAAPWPLPDRRFEGVIVTNYLWRPLLPHIVAAVASGGVLIFETFAVGQERLGRPSNPDFLLRPDELLEAVRGRLRVRAFEHGPVREPRLCMRSRICALAP